MSTAILAAGVAAELFVPQGDFEATTSQSQVHIDTPQ